MTEKKSLDDLQSFPILTSETGPRVSRRPGGSGAALGQTVEQALYETLGWRPRISDPHGFVAALTQAFTSEEVEERTIWKWTPHMYTVQADLGAVTGAQASIYKRATVIRHESKPLLEGLRPLLPDADEEDTEASRAIVESNLIELVDELGLVGGPRVQRVDTFFQILLGISPGGDTPDNAEQVGGELGLLRDRFGLQRDLVNTIEEEQNLTNFLILVDYILSLRQGWVSQRGFFNRSGTDVFLGTQLVLISRELASLVEAVYEARDALDSVFVGDADRQSLFIPLDSGETQLTIEELLAWAERFGSEEAPRLIREGGKKGLRSILLSIDELRELLRRAWDHSLEEASNPVQGFHTPRVARTFEELVTHADEVYKRAGQLDGAPFIERVEPNSGSAGQEYISVQIQGDNFKEDITEEDIDFGEGINIDGPTKDVLNDTIEVNIIIDSDAQPGFRDVTVTNPDGKVFTKKRAFEVKESETYMDLLAIGFANANGVLIGEEIDIEQALEEPPVLNASDKVAQIVLQFTASIEPTSINYASVQLILFTEVAMIPIAGSLTIPQGKPSEVRIVFADLKSPLGPGIYRLLVLGQPHPNAIESIDGLPVERTYVIGFRVDPVLNTKDEPEEPPEED